MKILSIAVGENRSYLHQEKEFFSSFEKKEVSDSLQVDKNGFLKDFQSDKRFHGGEEKALMVFAQSSAEKFIEDFQKKFPIGIFGENLRVNGLDESNVCIGDRYKIGNVEVEVSQPRQPCWKVSFFLGIKEGTRYMYKSALTGWYFRVLNSGEISPNDTVEKIYSGHKKFTIENVNNLMNKTLDDQKLLSEILEYEPFSHQYKNDLVKRKLK